MTPAIALFAFFIFSLHLQAQYQTVIDFTNPLPVPPIICGDACTENGIPVQMVPIPPDQDCSFDYGQQNPDGLCLWPARAIFTLSGCSSIDSIKVFIHDFCGAGCTTAEVSANGTPVGTYANTQGFQPDVYTFVNTNNDPVDQLWVQSFEGCVTEIIIYGGSCGSGSICLPTPDIHTESGDVYIEQACYGVILKSPNGICYRIRVDDNGTLITEMVVCP